MQNRFDISENGTGSYRVLAILRWVMVLIFIPFGRHKFVPQYEHGISIYVMNSPIVSWLSIFGERWESYIIGTIEFTTDFLLVLGCFISMLSPFGLLMGMCTSLITFSFLFSTPGVATWSLSSDPIVWNLMGQFLFKDIAIFSICLVLFLTSLPDDLLALRAGSASTS